MASSYQDTAQTEPSKETLTTESKATSAPADTKADNGNAVTEPFVDKLKLANTQLDGSDKADTQVEEDEDPTYSDDEDFPSFEGGQTRGKLKQPTLGAALIPRPSRPR